MIQVWCEGSLLCTLTDEELDLWMAFYWDESKDYQMLRVGAV